MASREAVARASPCGRHQSAPARSARTPSQQEAHQAVVTVVEILDVSGPPYNAALRAIPGVIAADWAPMVTANPSYVISDGVHQTPEGLTADRDLLLRAVSDCASRL